MRENREIDLLAGVPDGLFIGGECVAAATGPISAAHLTERLRRLGLRHGNRIWRQAQALLDS